MGCSTYVATTVSGWTLRLCKTSNDKLVQTFQDGWFYWMAWSRNPEGQWQNMSEEDTIEPPVCPSFVGLDGERTLGFRLPMLACRKPKLEYCNWERDWPIFVLWFHWFWPQWSSFWTTCFRASFFQTAPASSWNSETWAPSGPPPPTESCFRWRWFIFDWDPFMEKNSCNSHERTKSEYIGDFSHHWNFSSDLRWSVRCPNSKASKAHGETSVWSCCR